MQVLLLFRNGEAHRLGDECRYTHRSQEEGACPGATTSGGTGVGQEAGEVGVGWGRGGANLDRKLYCGFQEEEEQGGGVSRLRIGSFKRSQRLGADWALGDQGRWRARGGGWGSGPRIQFAHGKCASGRSVYYLWGLANSGRGSPPRISRAPRWQSIKNTY